MCYKNVWIGARGIKKIINIYLHSISIYFFNRNYRITNTSYGDTCYNLISTKIVFDRRLS
jgi:hypothetical protein